MNSEKDDREEAISAKMKWLWVKDVSRLIDQMGIESHRLAEPIRERRVRNHFLPEYEALYREREHH